MRFDIPTLQRAIPLLSLVPMLLAGMVAALTYQRQTANLRALVWLLAFAIPINLLAVVFALQHRNNLFLLPIDAVGEIALLAVVYARTLQTPWFTRLMPFLVGGFAAYVALDTWLGADLAHFRPGQQVVSCLLELLLVGLYFSQLLRELHVTHLHREPMFWVSAGLLVYAAGYLQIALFSNYLMHFSQQLTLRIWAINSLLFAALYCCYTRALWLSPRN